MKTIFDLHIDGPMRAQAYVKHLGTPSGPFSLLVLEIRDSKSAAEVSLFLRPEDATLAEAMAKGINDAAAEHGTPAQPIGLLADQVIAKAAEVAPARHAAE